MQLWGICKLNLDATDGEWGLVEWQATGLRDWLSSSFAINILSIAAFLLMLDYPFRWISVKSWLNSLNINKQKKLPASTRHESIQWFCTMTRSLRNLQAMVLLKLANSNTHWSIHAFGQKYLNYNNAVNFSNDSLILLKDSMRSFLIILIKLTPWSELCFKFQLLQRPRVLMLSSWSWTTDLKDLCDNRIQGRHRIPAIVFSKLKESFKKISPRKFGSVFAGLIFGIEDISVSRTQKPTSDVTGTRSDPSSLTTRAGKSRSFVILRKFGAWSTASGPVAAAPRGPADALSSFPVANMGGALSHFFQSGHALLSSSHNRNVSEQTRRNVRIVFDALCANPKVTVQRLDGLLSAIPRWVRAKVPALDKGNSAAVMTLRLMKTGGFFYVSFLSLFCPRQLSEAFIFIIFLSQHTVRVAPPFEGPD